MTAYADTISRPVKTLTEAEQRALLKVTGQHVDGFRDHVIFSLAMGTGLREHELSRSTSATCSTTPDAPSAASPARVQAFREGARRPGGAAARRRARQARAAPHDAQARGRDHHAHHAGLREPPRTTALGAPAPAPLRRSGRSAPVSNATWVSHAAPPRLQRRLPASKDLRLTQKFARHKSVVTTSIYTHPTDDELLRAVQGLVC